MTLHELILEFEAWIAKFRSHPDVQAIVKPVEPVVVAAPVEPAPVVTFAPAPVVTAAPVAPSISILDSYRLSGGNASTPEGKASTAAAEAAQALAAASGVDTYHRGFVANDGDPQTCEGTGSFELRFVGPCKLGFSYSAQPPGVQAPQHAFITIAGVEHDMPVWATSTLDVVGPATVSYRSDTGGAFNCVLAVA